MFKNNITNEYELKIDQYLFKRHRIYKDHYLIILNEPIPTNPLWFFTSMSFLIFGKDLEQMFSNVAFRFNPADENSPYVTLTSSDHDDTKNFDCGIRFLTEAESKLTSVTSQKEVDNDHINYVDHASKYLASNEEQAGLDLNQMSGLH